MADITFELFKTSARNTVDLRNHKKAITQCFNNHLPNFKIDVSENEITVLNYPNGKLPITISRAISAELLSDNSISQLSQVITTTRLLQKRNSQIYS